MKKFNVKVNGNSYEVEVEEIKDGVQPVAPAVQRPAAAPAPAPAAPTAAPAPKAAPVAVAGAGTVSAPMPGTVLDIMVKEGDVVKSGQVCVILEAMKMENELPAPCDGTVKSVNVTKGASVNTADVLVVIG
ncbi:MAG: biotin/lipoyl-binding protein [Proteocatella sp.]|nr:biotin/lipoyl-binding protein [Proteocatella sp.]MBP9966834.1 biotin/lipoyl-binding protein [Proteocatella sp.]